MPSKSLTSKSSYILHLSSEISATQLQQICFVPTKRHFSELIFEGQLFEPFSPGCVHSKQQCQASICSRAFYHQSTRLAQQTGRHTPAASSPPPRNINPLSLAHWSHTSGITSKYTFKWTVKRTAHLKIHKQGTKGLKVFAVQHAFSWCFLLKIFNKTKQSDQTGFLFFMLLWHLSITFLMIWK